MTNKNQTPQDYNNEIFEQKPPFSEINALNAIQSPTNPQWVKTRNIKGSNLSYVSGDLVIRLLNKAFKYRWSFEIKETKVVESADRVFKNRNTGQETITPQNPVVQTLGRLTVPGWGVREQWGAQPIIGGQDIQEHAFKASATDALKKCASMFGIALDLYGTEGMVDLAVTPQDYLADDEQSFETLKQRMVEAQKNNNLSKAEPEPEEISSLAEEEEESYQEEYTEVQTQQQETPVAESAPTSEPLDEVQQTRLETEEPAPVQEAPAPSPQPKTVESSVGKWREEDIMGMKRIKEVLNLKNNNDLDIYVKEFMNNQEATMLQHINPTNITDFITFMDLTHLK